MKALFLIYAHKPLLCVYYFKKVNKYGRIMQQSKKLWRSGRVVDCTCLENRSLGNRTVSSNLTSSASKEKTELTSSVFSFDCKEREQVTCVTCGDSNSARESASRSLRRGRFASTSAAVGSAANASEDTRDSRSVVFMSAKPPRG